jgi:hypothetical protein
LSAKLKSSSGLSLLVASGGKKKSLSIVHWISFATTETQDGGLVYTNSSGLDEVSLKELDWVCDCLEGGSGICTSLQELWSGTHHLESFSLWCAFWKIQSRQYP